MSEQIKEQAEKMREMAQATPDKGKEAVSNYMTESQKLREAEAEGEGQFRRSRRCAMDIGFA